MKLRRMCRIETEGRQAREHLLVQRLQLDTRKV